MPSLLMIQERSYFSAIFLKDHLFSTFEENIKFPCIFLGKIIFRFLSKEYDHIFGEKKYHLS